MASLYDFKPWFQSTLRPITGWLARAGATANGITVAALVMSTFFGMTFFLSAGARPVLLLLPLILLIRMALNAIDGMLAREHGQKTDRGFFLNELTDVAADAALYLPFAILPGASAMLVVFAVGVSGLAELAGVLALGVGAARRYDGPFGKSDRALAFGALAFLLAFFDFTPILLNAIFGLFIGLGTLTIFRRVNRALIESEAAKRDATDAD